MRYYYIFLFIFISCNSKTETKDVPPSATHNYFDWNTAAIYFLLTDRFHNGNTSNDINYDRNTPTAVLRGFEGGDLAGITKKINEGYFNQLGIDAIWLSPVLEQVKGAVDEGTGLTYAYHGYWTKDWTALDPNFGTEKELKQMIEAAHGKNLRILFDVVINHTGPVTDLDPVWPVEWVRTEPACTFDNYKNTTACTLVENLPDIKTESEADVELPATLIEKWKSEGRLKAELESLEAFFKRTGYPRAPKYYIMKWLTDYIRTYGLDGFRVDTVKHTEEDVWKDLQEEAETAFDDWKKANPQKVVGNQDFYMVGEVYNYKASDTLNFYFSDQKVNYFDNGFNALINFEFTGDSDTLGYDALFTKYNQLLNGGFKEKSVLHYLSSHDDPKPFDPERKRSYEAATKLMLAPGAIQIYYGDETARRLIAEGANGDANLRSFMNWETLKQNEETKKILRHWQKLGRFRQKHPSIGRGLHQKISEAPYLFSRQLFNDKVSDKVLIGLELPKGEKIIEAGAVFEEGELVTDYYSGTTAIVNNGLIKINSGYTLVLIEN